jgi:hypothetical protein
MWATSSSVSAGPTSTQQTHASTWNDLAKNGSLCGNGKMYDDRASEYEEGDRVGVLLDLNDGSLRFFKNGMQNGPGYAAGSVTGPVVHAVQLFYKKSSVRLLPDAEAPANAWGGVPVQWSARRETWEQSATSKMRQGCEDFDPPPTLWYPLPLNRNWRMFLER